MDISPPQSTSTGVELDSPPPRPPAGEAKNLMQLSGVKPPAAGGGLGEMSNSPQLMALQGLAMAKHGFNLLAVGVPALAQILSNTIADLERMVPMAMADAQAGMQPPVTAPPGVAPMMGPPPAMGGAPGPAGPPGPQSGPPQGGPPMGPGPRPM